MEMVLKIGSGCFSSCTAWFVLCFGTASGSELSSESSYDGVIIFITRSMNHHVSGGLFVLLKVSFIHLFDLSIV